VRGVTACIDTTGIPEEVGAHSGRVPYQRNPRGSFRGYIACASLTMTLRVICASVLYALHEYPLRSHFEEGATWLHRKPWRVVLGAFCGPVGIGYARAVI